jgi:site-specific recombinase XerD
VGFEPTEPFGSPVFKTEGRAFFPLFSVVLTVSLQEILPFAALWRILPRMARQPKRPTLTSCKVSQTTNPRAPWRVFYHVEQDGKKRRVFKSFADEEKAWAFAVTTDREIENHGIRYGDIPPEVRRAFDFYRDESAALRGEGGEVPAFEDLVGGALREIRERFKQSIETSVSVAEAVEMFKVYKKTRVKERQRADIADRLKRFAQDFGTRPMPSVTTQEIDTWLANLRSRRNPEKLKLPPLLAPLSRNNYRAVLHSFFEYATASARAWCPRNPLADLEPEQFASRKPKAYKPEDAAKLMQTALESMPEILPAMALGMFAGLRTSELLEIDLASLTLEEDEFRVEDEHKTGARMAPFTAACKAWVFAQKRRKGKLWTKCPRTFVDERQKLFALAGVEQIKNGARDSFISYRCAETKDIAKVADECGNSVGTIKKHYRQIVSAAAAAKYFAIRPEAPAANVTDIGEGRASA